MQEYFAIYCALIGGLRRIPALTFRVNAAMRSALSAFATLLLAQGVRGVLFKSSNGATSGATSTSGTMSAAVELAKMFANEDDWGVECRIFAYWDYPNGVPYYIEKDLQSWAYHSKNRCGYPVLINDTNIKEFIPDLPDEYFRLPDHGSKSDIIRYALVYHNGGMYLDTDILVVKDMDDIIWKVKQDYDLVSYAGQENCRSFSSNFLAGRKGSALHKAIWEKQKEKLKTPCGPDPKLEIKKVCCSANPKEKCHIPWGGVGEMISHPIFDEFVASNQSKHYCYAEKDGESFVPEGFGTVLFSKPMLEEGLDWFEKQKAKKPMDRIMYHLFSAQGFQSEYDGPGIFDERYVVGQLYRKSLEKFITIPEPESGTLPSAYCASDGEMCRCAGTVFFGKTFPGNKQDGDRLELRDMVISAHRVLEVNGEIPCNAARFGGGDPQGGKQKQCICQPQPGLVAKTVFDDGPAELCASEGQRCKCTGKAHYGLRFGGNGNSEPLDWASFVKTAYYTKEVKGEILCNPGAFGGDPQVTKQKQCYCQPQAKLS
eukprot:gb/GFBE01048708.1/.p1 GENE.gb/GFBE01048708.1/~~gb/GFBE01048708.1/.p1  ORF type:complete len:542 (+),score=122.14 gb/GFBE01048708.1/:1-1626(+)